jgi:hypothetical protein
VWLKAVQPLAIKAPLQAGPMPLKHAHPISPRDADHRRPPRAFQPFPVSVRRTASGARRAFSAARFATL